ncbi:benzoate/H(+) symporter BenE family transporter [Marinomonas sp. MED121]|uniref:benzoate/H(+) symporter BenE family transporter n=1 Tax=Marinomonas sp. MED121 TaxID=314277 RepID=UPI001A946FCE|nr:benzoate/H(+) symporter BenE family transporter [Marinomonas sp. MED121]
MSIKEDISVSAVVAGFVAVLVGFASSVAIVMQAALAAGADERFVISWITALGIGMGLTCFFLSWYYKKPVITAWSTPGAALLVTGLDGVTYSQAIGVFVVAGGLILLVGITGIFNRLMSLIPYQIACAMLAGILFQFGIAVFDVMVNDVYRIFIMFLCYLVAKRYFPRYAILVVLVIALILVFATNEVFISQTSMIAFSPALIWQSPSFDLKLIIGVALPLFIVTMTAQNLPGVVALKAHKIDVPTSSIISWTGLTTILLAPFGGFAFNLAAITASICMGVESHKVLEKRYIAGLSAGVFYCLAGLFGGSIIAVFSLFPQSIIIALAGLALISTIAINLKTALDSEPHREAALITFLVTISDISFFDISSAFWGIAFGLVCLCFIPKK